MDSFFASVEQRDSPQYKGKPLVVSRHSPRSVIAAASYEARRYGIRSAMPLYVALRKCPQLIVVPHRFDVYREVSHSIKEIFNEYTNLVEPLSLDEAYLDVTNPKKGPASASLIAMEIKKKIKQKVNLIASAGVSYNKFLAKIASDMDKPDGFYLIKPEDAEDFLEKADISLFYGIGKKTKEKMHKMSIFKGGDLKKLSLNTLTKYFGKSGLYYYNAVRGIDERPVISYRECKSIGAERTYQIDIFDIDAVKEKLNEVIELAWKRCETKKKTGKTISLKLRFSDFTTITRSRTQTEFITKDKAKSILTDLLPIEEIKEHGIRLLGATISHFETEDKHFPIQLKINFNSTQTSDTPPSHY